MRDLEVLEYFFGLMEEVTAKLERSVSSNNFEETEKLKKIILDMSSSISGELV
jgi:hypothetical protein